MDKNNNNQHQDIVYSTIKIDNEIKNAYFNYAYEIITERAIPHIFDGLKPVQRRILYAHHKYHYNYYAKHRKSAHVVGAVLGEFHPHGDSSVYEALIRMGQDFSMRETLINIQGNYGSIDGDPAASMRYTEAKLTKLSQEFFHDIDYNTVDFVENYDNTSKEPVLLPVRFPNILLNGSQGIAVGISTSIPPHNLEELIDGVLYLIDNPDCTISDIMKIIPGPDFPTGCTIINPENIYTGYSGKETTIKVKSKYEIENNNIIFSEIPFQIKKSDLLEKLGLAIKNDVIQGISSIRDESDMNGIAVRVKVKDGYDPYVVVNQIFKHTPFLHFFRIAMFALDKNNSPKLFNIKEILENFIHFRDQVIIRRCNHTLNQLSQKINIQIGYSIAFDNIDFFIDTIQNKDDSEEILSNTQFDCVSLRDYFQTLGFDNKHKHKLSSKQIKHILDLKLSNLKKIEINNIKVSLSKMNEQVKQLTEIVNCKEKRLDLIREELESIRKFSSPRRTQIISENINVDHIDLIQEEEVLVTASEGNYVQRIPLEEYKAQNRGGKGKKGYQFSQHVVTNTKQEILIFSSHNKVYKVHTYKIPSGHLNTKGRSILNVLPMGKEEDIKLLIPVYENNNNFIVFVFENGNVRKNPISIFEKINRAGKAYNNAANNPIREIILTSKDDEILLATKGGKLARIPIDKFNIVNTRTGIGVKGISLRKEDHVISSINCSPEDLVLTITENAYGKLCKVKDYRITNRSAQGVNNINPKSITKVGNVVKILQVNMDEEVILFSQNGKSIRINVTLKTIHRTSIGVKLFNLDKDDKIIDVKKLSILDK